jgi:hypothetical protein
MPFTRQQFSSEESKTLYPELQGRDRWLDTLAVAIDSESGARLISISYLVGYDRYGGYRFDDNREHIWVEFWKNEGFVWHPGDELSVAEMNTRSRKIQEAIGCLLAYAGGPNPSSVHSVRALPRPKDVLRKNKMDYWLTLGAIVSSYLVLLSFMLFLLFRFI